MIRTENNINIGCADIEFYIFELCRAMALNKYDAVIGIARGGMVPAVYFSHFFDAPLEIVTCHRDNLTQSQLPEFSQYQRILIVDDITDSGITMGYVSQFYRSKGLSAETASLIHKKECKFTPNYVGHTVPQKPWVVFPWEINKEEIRKALEALRGSSSSQ